MVAKVYVRRISAMPQFGIAEKFEVRVKVNVEDSVVRLGRSNGFDFSVGEAFVNKEDAFVLKNAVIMGFSDCFCTDEIEELQ